jgi:hypothetical protein
MHQAASHSYIDRFCAPGNLELFQNMRDVYLDRRFADVKQGADFFVAFAAGQRLNHFQFSCCQRPVSDSLSRSCIA